MRVFCCRWPNGDISFVLARNKEEAVLALDEVGNAETSDIFPAPEFMLHLRLEDDGQLSFQGFGEVTECEILPKAYPVLETLAEFPKPSASSVREAVRKERKRLEGRKGEEPETLIGKNIKRKLDAPTALVNKIVREQAKKRLRNFKPKGKPQ